MILKNKEIYSPICKVYKLAFVFMVILIIT